MREITLSQGMVALVDDEDYETVNRWKWSAKKGRYTYYAMCKKNGRSDGRTIHLHRIILNATEMQEIDHVNGDGLDNRRCNLRFCTNSQNQANKRAQKNCSSKYKGVSWKKSKKRWLARITVQGKTIYLGSYLSEKNAAFAYNMAAMEHYGDFARLNEVA